MTPISISRVHFPITTLGPGRRLGIWLQGCSIRCPGCISVDTWKANVGETSVPLLMETVRPWIAAAQGITISGGEPFDQPEALRQLLGALRAQTTVDILVYSGHPFAELKRWLKQSPDLIDVLISEPYVESESQTLALRGSDNQQMHLLTKLGHQRFAAYSNTAGERRFDIMFDDAGTVWMAGIPGRKDFNRLRTFLRDEGHQVMLSDAPIASKGT